MTDRPQAERGEVIASLSHAWKFYGSFAALSDVSLELRRGEVHMLLGENGAGKSTLVSLLVGTHMLDRGLLFINGEEVTSYSPTEARRRGINAVLQDLSLAPSLTVAENYFLGRELTKGGFLRRGEMKAEATEAIRQLGIEIDVDMPVERLSRAEQQVLEIVRALGGRPGALILDEPTSTLSHEESHRLFTIIDRLRGEGWAILYITHRLEEVRRLGDRVTVLRDGRMTGSYQLANISNDRLIQDMIGRPLRTLYPKIRSHPGKTALEIVQTATADRKLRDVSLMVRYGEIVGVGGLVGCGKGDLARAIFGLVPVASGALLRNGRMVTRPQPHKMLNEGLVYLPQDRRYDALALNRSIAENVSLEVLSSQEFTHSGFVRIGAVQRLVSTLMERLDIRPRNADKPVQELSGGNQQKVVLGRALSRNREVYIFDEPTAGIDVGARSQFYEQVKNLCKSGAAILLITSDLQELIHLAHRIYVMHRGRTVAEMASKDASEDMIVAYSFGEKLPSTGTAESSATDDQA